MAVGEGNEGSNGGGGKGGSQGGGILVQWRRLVMTGEGKEGHGGGGGGVSYFYAELILGSPL